MTLTVEDFSSLLLPAPVDYNEDEILDDEALCGFRVMLYVLETKSAIRSVAGDGELQGHHREAMDASENRLII